MKSATIGQNRALPVHETVQAPQFRDDLGTGAKCQVIGIGQNLLDTHFPQLVRRQAFDGRQRPNRHEGRRLSNAMRRHPPTRSGSSLAVGTVEIELKRGHGGSLQSSVFSFREAETDTLCVRPWTLDSRPWTVL